MPSIAEAARTLEDEIVEIIAQALRAARNPLSPTTEYDLARNAARQIADLQGMAER